jgi:hypothetical protein
LAQNVCDVNKFLVRHKKFGPAQKILRHVKGQGNRVLQTIQMKLLCVWAERADLGSAKNALKFKYEI